MEEASVCPITFKERSETARCHVADEARGIFYDADKLHVWASICLAEGRPPTYPHNCEPIPECVRADLAAAAVGSMPARPRHPHVMVLNRIDDPDTGKPCFRDGIVTWVNGDVVVRCERTGEVRHVTPGYELVAFTYRDVNPWMDKAIVCVRVGGAADVFR